MVNPVLSCIQGQGEVSNVVHANAVAKLKEDTQGRSRKKSMRWAWENVKVGDMFRTCDTIRDQVLSHRKVRELDNFFAIDFDNSNQGGASRYYDL